MAFSGLFDHTLDSKNRLTVPRQSRSAFADGAVLAIPPDLQPCVWIARASDYEDYVSKALGELSPLAEDRLALERFYGASSHEVELDGRERVMLPTRFVLHAQLERELVLVGAGWRIECWDRAQWANYQPALAEEARAITARASHAA